jgi:hypothetical protein
MGLVRLSMVVVVLAGAVVLVLTNPTIDDYLLFVETELGRAIDQMDQSMPTREQQFIRQVFRTQSKKLVESIVRPSTIRRNWGILSRFETQVADTTVVVLGISGQFIPIRGVEEATRRIGRMVFQSRS